MISRKTHLRIRKHIRKHKKLVSRVGESANKQLDRHFFRRWHNVHGASRFTLGWMTLLVILIFGVIVQTKMLGGYYLFNTPSSGGVYTEGMVGVFSGANPIYATTNADLSVSKLVFASLLTYDNKNQLVGDLAQSWEVDDKGTTYTVKLKNNLLWQDGQSLTSDDVVYTFQTIQNPDAKSPLLANWMGIKIEKVDNMTVKFILPNAYSPFIYSLTTGIVPKHILSNISASQLRSAAFNTENPIGSGPFRWKNISVTGINANDKTEVIQMTRFDNYRSSQAKLDGITLNLYPNIEDLNNALSSNKIIAASGMNLEEDKYVQSNKTLYDYPLMSANMLFLKNTSSILSDVKVRQALTKATNTSTILSELGHTSIPVKGPLLKGQIGYDPKVTQQTFNKTEAAALLDSAGWTQVSGDQFRKKDGKELTLTLKYDNQVPEYQGITESLKKQWAELGINLEINSEEKQAQKLLDTHDYDILLYGINIGYDPDVYAYWHSSQLDKKLPVHLNISEYKSKASDLALEAARTRTDPKVRAAKYKSFLDAWQSDAPAIGLYQSRYLVVANQPIYGVDARVINVPADRFNNVNQWMINTKRITK